MSSTPRRPEARRRLREPSPSRPSVCRGDVRRCEPFRRLDEPRFLEALAELLPVDRLESDLDSGPSVVVRAREVHVRIRLQDQRLLVPLDPDSETATVSLASGPREALAANLKCDTIPARLLRLGERERELAHRFPIDHFETLTRVGRVGFDRHDS